MAPIDKELGEEIKKGVKLEKPDEEELKKEKKNRMEEVEKVKQALEVK